MGIVEFLEARIAEDEAVAKATFGTDLAYATWAYEGNEVFAPMEGDRHAPWMVTKDHEGCLPAVDENDGPHIARHDPARVLREIAAKRIILEIHHASDSEVTYPKWDSEARIIGLTNPCMGCGTGICDYWTQDINNCPELQALASIYLYHPDFKEEWRP